MNEFIKKMLQLGAELEKTEIPMQASMIINDAEILYRDETKALTIPNVSQQRELLNALADKFNDSTHTYVGQPMIEETLKAINYTHSCTELCDECSRENHLQKLTDQAQYLGLGYDD
tara:strand:- start:698 stop:1048 length:351 start_codon:yes stop_codon:yes gene_type:complete